MTLNQIDPADDRRTRPRSPADDDDDDRLIGRVLSRREVLALMGAVSISAVAAACAPGSIASGLASPTATAGASATHSGDRDRRRRARSRRASWSPR